MSNYVHEGAPLTSFRAFNKNRPPRFELQGKPWFG